MCQVARWPVDRLFEVVPGDGGDGVVLQADPGHPGIRWLDPGEHDLDGAIGPMGRLLAVDAAHDAG